MRRIRDSRENETEQNARDAFDRYATGKHKRASVRRYEAELGQPTERDAEYYAFTGSKIMIDQALNDFTREDLPVPTVIQQFRGKDGKDYTKFT